MSGRREAVRRAIEEAEEEGSLTRSSPPAATPPAPGGTLRDACAACRTPLRVHETTWRTATTAWGFWARANLCGAAECAAIWWETPPEVIADELRDRLLQADERGG